MMILPASLEFLKWKLSEGQKKKIFYDRLPVGWIVFSDVVRGPPFRVGLI